MCTYVCLYVNIHMFHVSTHVDGDQTLASYVFSWSLSYFWDMTSHWTRSSLTQQGQQAVNFKSHLHPRSRNTDGCCSTTPGFLQGCWGSYSKHCISPAHFPPSNGKPLVITYKAVLPCTLSIAVFLFSPRRKIHSSREPWHLHRQEGEGESLETVTWKQRHSHI